MRRQILNPASTGATTYMPKKGIRIGMLTMDREFFSTGVIGTLRSKKIQFLMPQQRGQKASKRPQASLRQAKECSLTTHPDFQCCRQGTGEVYTDHLEKGGQKGKKSNPRMTDIPKPRTDASEFWHCICCKEPTLAKPRQR